MNSFQKLQRAQLAQQQQQQLQQRRSQTAVTNSALLAAQQQQAALLLQQVLFKDQSLFSFALHLENMIHVQIYMGINYILLFSWWKVFMFFSLENIFCKMKPKIGSALLTFVFDCVR